MVRSPVRVAATVDMTARPSEPPIVREVLTSPETRPASSAAAPEVARDASGVAARPAPSIISTPGSMMEVTYPPSAVIIDCRPKPAAATSVPSTATLRAPRDGISQGAPLEPSRTASELGMRATPASSGL